MTEAEWKDVDEAFISKMEAMDQHELVRLLWDGDDDAWRYVYARAVVPMLRGKSLGRMARDRQRSELDICGAVYEKLLFEKKLALYHFGCPVVFWIRYWVKRDILGYCKKNDNPVSDEVVERVLKYVAATESDWASKEEAVWCFSRLWENDRRKAQVLYLKTVEERTAKEIMEILGLSSVENVNQLGSRACARMREFRHKSEKSGNLMFKSEGRRS